MKIGLVAMNYSPEVTGVAAYTSSLSRHLAVSNSMWVITAQPHYPQWAIWPGYEGWISSKVEDGVLVRRLLHYVPKQPRGVRRLISEISFGLRAMTHPLPDSDVLILVSPALFSSAILMLRLKFRRKNLPVVTWLQDIYSLGMKETGQGSSVSLRIVAAVEKWMLQNSTRVVVIHNRFKRYLKEQLEIPIQKIEVIRNWSHISNDNSEVKASGGEEIQVLHSGNMGKKQGLENVVEAAKLAQDRSLPIRFTLIGDGSEKEYLLKLAQGLKVIEFRDHLHKSTYLSALQRADFLLLNESPGVSEMAVPSKLTSYFVAGRPVIAATDPMGITAEEIRSSKAGIVIPAGDPEALIEAILALAANKTLAQEFAINGQRYAWEVLSEKSAFSAFESLLSLTLRQT